MKEKNAKLDSREFVPNKHNDIINYIITIGGDGTILYGCKFFKT